MPPHEVFGTAHEALAPGFNVGEAVNSRIAMMNNAVLGTAINLLPAAVGIGVLIYGFRKVYEKTLGNII
ncbi:hypothetical protein A2881_04010 [Candidatus Peribacteria bacterium RIFCSPHIGHO2_01_FULL_55_13]|nr:MAG: hypothetical protein A2881_04010 [Candidatus Peribacteria bacterium RIFCSPHIGHO2_01_FULL_55_13]OGJ64830.1 MAG: hypothetical protein A3F36_00150 [Candidatus Peribacteria bacterium RIFCSPHIGHO2_12_FULL_55_11]